MRITFMFSIILIIPLLLSGQNENTKKATPVDISFMGDIKAGKKVFMTTCFVCHGLDGKGAIPGVPDFTKTAERLAQPDSVLLEHVINGFQSPGSVMPMPPKGGNANLTEQNILDAITYIRGQFGNPDQK